MRAFAQYALYFLLGLVQLFWLLLVWGVSAGPANWMPYALLLAFLTLVLVAPELSLFLEKPAALVALIGGTAGVAWALGGLVTDQMNGVEVALLGVPPAVVTVDAVTRLARRWNGPWLRLRPGLTMPLRVVLALLPVGVVGTGFNGPLLARMLWHWATS